MQELDGLFFEYGEGFYESPRILKKGKNQNSTIDNAARKMYAIDVIVTVNDNIYSFIQIPLPYKLLVY